MKTWKRPLTMVQKFEANEYCAGCESGITYLFDCNAGGGAHADIYLADGTNLTAGGSRYFHACDAKHEASTTSDFESGYMLLNGGSDETGHWVRNGFLDWDYVEYEKIPVIIWRGDGDVHATITLNQNEWEVTRS